MKNDAIILKPDQIEAEWYSALIEECKAIITEAVFTSRWALVEGYHTLGKRILQEHDNFERAKIYGEKICARVSISLGISRQTINRSIQFVQKYPDLSKVPEGKNITWHKICNKYLPAPKESEAETMPPGKYRVIYADPPWKYDNTMPDYFTEQGDHYSLMTVEEIANLPIHELSEDNAVLFLWATSPILEEAFQVINKWGFAYKSSFVWDKVKHNMGHYNSVRHEFLLIAVKGSCQPDTKKLFDSVQTIERPKEHSKKPEKFREIIDILYPQGQRIELFARGNIPSKWTGWGNELT